MKFANVLIFFAMVAIQPPHGLFADDVKAATDVVSPGTDSDIAGLKQITLRSAKNGEKVTAIFLDGTAEGLSSQEKDSTHLLLSLEHRSKGLGTVEKVDVARIWLDGGTVYLQWTDAKKAKEAADELKYSLLHLRTADKRDVAVCQFVEPQKLSLKLHGVEKLPLTDVEAIFDKLKLAIANLPDGWKATTPTDDGRKIVLKHASTEIRFDFIAEGKLLHSVVELPGAAPVVDPQVRVRTIDNQIATLYGDIKKLRIKISEAGVGDRHTDAVELRASYQRTINSKFATIETLQQERAQVGQGAAPNGPVVDTSLPTSATLKLLLPNGVCVVEVSLAGR